MCYTSRMTSFLYRIARLFAWGRAVSRAAQGHPQALVKRVRNKMVYRAVGRLLR